MRQRNGKGGETSNNPLLAMSVGRIAKDQEASVTVIMTVTVTLDAARDKQQLGN